MKNFFYAFILPCFLLTPLAHAWAATEIWSVTDSIDTPESAYFDPDSGFIFVSNIAGAPDQKDGKGWISKLSVDGKIVNSKWVDGISAPKGLRAKGGILWVTNIDEMISIDIKAGKILSRITVPGSKFLNDPAIGEDGTLYVSDTPGNTIFQIKGGKPSVFMKGPQTEGPNGLLIHGSDLIVAGWGVPNPDWSTKVPGRLFRINLKTKKKGLITTKPLGNLDGLEIEEDGNFLVSDWIAGKVYRVSDKGSVKEILSGFKNSADIGYVPGKKIILVPSMGASKISAFTDF